MGNRMPVRTIIPDELIRERLSQDFYGPIVVYEDNDPNSDSIGALVAATLHSEGVKEVHFLEGESRDRHMSV